MACFWTDVEFATQSCVGALPPDIPLAISVLQDNFVASAEFGRFNVSDTPVFSESFTGAIVDDQLVFNVPDTYSGDSDTDYLAVLGGVIYAVDRVGGVAPLLDGFFDEELTIPQVSPDGWNGEDGIIRRLFRGPLVGLPSSWDPSKQYILSISFEIRSATHDLLWADTIDVVVWDRAVDDLHWDLVDTVILNDGSTPRPLTFCGVGRVFVETATDVFVNYATAHFKGAGYNTCSEYEATLDGDEVTVNASCT